MRRSTVVVLLLLAHSSTSWGQAPVETTAGSPVETSAEAAPLPGLDTYSSPSKPDLKAVREVTNAPTDPAIILRPGFPDRDLISRHWFLGATVGFASPFGNFTSKSPIGSRLGGAYVFGLDAGYGLSRHLQVWFAGDYAHASSGSACSSCNADSYSVGAKVRYHLVEGTRFDPWVGYGVAFRWTTSDSFRRSQTFNAIEPLRLELGGDWYASSVFTLGPIVAIAANRTFQTNDDSEGRWSTWISAGLRIGLDPTGR